MDYGWESSGLLGLIVDGFRTQFDASGDWMSWNLVLATAPWLLSLIVFHPSRRTGVLWFAGAIGCLVLLPNAPYILTDIVHLPPAVRREPSDTAVLLVVFPLYAALFAFAFAVYSDTLRRISRYAIAHRWVSRASAIELPLHAICAVAIYVGRVHRLNSWDVAFQPLTVATRTLVGFTRPMALAGILLMFLALATAQTFTRALASAGLRRIEGLR